MLKLMHNWKLLQFGNCLKGGGDLTWIQIFWGTLKKMALLTKILVDVKDIKKTVGGGQGDFDNVQIEADFSSG